MLSTNDTKDINEVFFVDYGDTEWIPRTSVQPIHPSLLQVFVTIHDKTNHIAHKSFLS